LPPKDPWLSLRYFVDLFQSWLKEHRSKSLAEILPKARRQCKLPYLVGSAPVCYGVPVYLKKKLATKGA
jgi:separase